MAMDEFYTSRVSDGVRIQTFRQSQILDAVTIERMTAALKELIEQATEGRFIFDFERVTYLSSAALGMLISLQRRVATRKAQLKLAGITEEIMEVFRITKLDTVFDIYKDVASAAEAFRKNL